MSDLDLLPIGTLTLDDNFIVISASLQFRKIFNCDDSAVVGRQFQDLFGPRERRSLSRLDQAMSSYSDGLLDMRLVVMVFGNTNFHCRLKLLKIEKKWIAFISDVLKDDDFLHQLTVSEEIWTSIMNESVDAIAVLGADRLIKRFNNAFSEIMKFKSVHDVLLNEDAILGKDLTQFSCNKGFLKLFDFLSDGKLSPINSYKEIVEIDMAIFNVEAYPLQVPVKGFSGTCIIIRDLTAQHQNEKLRLKNAHYTGMTEVATGIIHNIGNLINGVNIGLETLKQCLRLSKLSGLQKATDMLRANQNRMSEFLATDPKGKALIEYIIQITGTLKSESVTAEQEVGSMLTKLNVIKEVIHGQQDYAHGKGLVEKVDVRKVVEESIQIQMASLQRHEIEIKTNFTDIDPVSLQRNKLVHILINLLTNAKDALKSPQQKEKIVMVTIGKTKDNFPFVKITDNGPGIPTENLDKIFAHGFTTKPDGHGFGLHFCANAMTEMGGQLIVENQSDSSGATFTLIWKNL